MTVFHRERRRRPRAWWAAVALLAVTACSPSPSTDAGSPSEGPVPTGGTLRVAIGQGEPSLSVLDYKSHSFALLDQIYEPLVRYGPDGKLLPGLATSWETSGDGKTLTFKLRQGVTFSDGAAFDSTVAKTGMQKWIDSEDHNWMGLSTNVAGVDTPDAGTLVLRLKKAYYPALQELTYVRPVRFLSPNAFDASGTVTKPIGTGPYKVDSISNTEVVLLPNPTYWGGKPNLDKLIFKVIPEAQARVTALRAGEVDLIGGQYLSPLAPADAVALKSASDVRILSAPSSTNLLLAFNQTTGNAALRDPKVREAISHAVDRDGYAKALFGGYATPASQVFPPSIPFAPKASAPTLAKDPAKATSLLQSAGVSGLKLTMILDPEMMPESKALSEAIQADLAKAGVTLEIKSMDSTAYGEAWAARQYDVILNFTHGPPYDPFGFLRESFRTDTDYQIYGSPQLDALIDEATVTTSDQARQAAYDKIWTTLDDNWAAVPLVETQRIWAVRTAVKGFDLGPTEYDLPLQRVGVAG